MPDTAPVAVVPSAGFAPIVAAPVPIAPPPMTAAYPTTTESLLPPAIQPPPPPFPESLTPPTAAGGHGGPGRALGIGSLAVGAFAALGAALPVVNIASVALAATGAALGIAALFQLTRSRGIALAGTIVSVVALTTSVALATIYTGIVTWTAESVIEGAGSLPAVVDDYAEETISAADPGAPSGTADDPLPLGETIVVTREGEPRWEITLGEATYDAEEEVLLGSGAADVSSDLAGEPAQFAYVSAVITYLGEDSASLYEEVYVCFTTADETFWCAGEIASDAPGTDLSLTDSVESGETVEGNFLVAIPAAAENDGHWSAAGEWTDFLYVATS